MTYHELDISELKDRHVPSKLGRRSFIKRFGGGLTIAVALSDFSMVFGSDIQKTQRELPKDFNAFLHIAEDGKVTCYTGKIEMGQGVITSIPQSIAEELDVAVDDVEILMGDTDLCPYDAGTWGSMTTRFFVPPLRDAAAEARAVLLQMASEKLNQPVEKLTVENGVILVKGNSKDKITYAQLTKGKKILRSLEGKPKLKDPSEFKIVGKSLLRRDARQKVTGEAKYAGDIRLSNMLYARMLRPPGHDAILKNVNTSKVSEVKGAQLVRDGDFIAVLHKDPELANAALNKIEAEFDVVESEVDQNNIFEYLVKIGTKEGEVQKGGKLDEGRANADEIIETEFHDGYVAHAPIEPHTAAAVVEGDKISIWASTQTPFGVQEQVAKALEMPLEKVHMHQVFLGGGFGGKIDSPQAVEVARIAKLSGKAVQLAWDRTEEFMYDTYRPAAVVKVTSGVEKSGKVSMWDYGVYFAGARGSQLFYNIPHHKVSTFSSGNGKSHFFKTGAWRAPANNTNTFARESQLDMLAHKIGMDPLEFRMKNLTEQRMIRTLKAAADKFGWTTTNRPEGKGYGIACGFDAGTYVAMIGEVEVDKNTGQVLVKRVVTAQDMGLVINPQGSIIQVEGGINMGLGYALSEDIEFNGGTIRTRNFDRYNITKFSMTPEKFETVLLDLPNDPAQGGGEPAIICVGGMVANAVFDAVGARVLQMPITPERVLKAMG